MSKINSLSREVPPTEHTFTIAVEGEITKKLFAGEFTCRIPTRKDQCNIDKHRAMLNGDGINYLSPTTLAFHHQIAYLRFTLKEVPKFWREADLGYELYDSNVVTEVYDRVLEFEKQWLVSIWGDEALTRFELGPKDEQSEEA